MRRILLLAAAAVALVCASSCREAQSQDDFGYIVQVFTGGWNNKNYETADVIARLDTLSKVIPIQKVIIGWNLDAAPYKEIGEFLHSRDIKMILWLPVFSEIGELAECDLSVDLWGNVPASYALQEGENFTFFCPSSERNVQNFIGIYEQYFAECGFDGVFIDKIRSQSFLGGVSGVLSCGCERCKGLYVQKGVDLEEVRTACETQGDAFFSVGNELADKYFQAKADIISTSVGEICDWFHAKGMEVGMDLFAPLMAKFVGQDYAALSAKADFIKPMLYRKTEAPAGIGFEYNSMREAVPGAEGYPEIETDLEFLKGQLDIISAAACDKYPGIEVNYREEFARTDPEYIKESIQAVKDAGFSGAVLSWDIMLAPDSHIECL